MTLAACAGSADGVPVSEQAQPDNDAPSVVATDEALVPETTTSPSTTAAATSTTTLLDVETGADVDTNTEVDENRAPPTTETTGLASETGAAPAPDGLACWRIEDFGEEAADRWRVINDGVMGGLSEGELTFNGGVATFAGTINTNGGGFSMIRTSVLRNGATLREALEEAEYLRIRTRSANGRRYELTVQDATTNSSVMHFADITVSADSAWEEPIIPLTNLDARTFGTSRPTLAPFELDQISTLGVILADGLDGPFSLAIDRIDACATT